MVSKKVLTKMVAGTPVIQKLAGLEDPLPNSYMHMTGGPPSFLAVIWRTRFLNMWVSPSDYLYGSWLPPELII